ncbi:MAG: pitrilysin family protein [Candidatus Nanoarchaeia archaeon]|jgi:predicted Zn-dependent peptidase
MGKYFNFNKYTMDNGLNVAYRKTDSNITLIDLNIGSGSLTENNNEKGLCHLLEHCIYNGATAKYTPKQLDDIKSNFGYSNASTSIIPIYFRSDLLKEDVESCLDFLSQIALNSKFDETTLDQEKQRVLREICDHKTNKSIYGESFNDAFFGNSRVIYDVLGDAEIIKKASVNDLMNIYKRNFNINNMGLFLYGGLPDNIDSLISNYFGNYSKGKKLEFNVKKLKPQIKSSFLYFKDIFLLNENNPDLSSAQFSMRLNAPNFNEKYYYEMQILNDFLGNSYNSRLHSEISAKKGLAYNIDSKFIIEPSCNYLSIAGMIQAQKYKKVINSVFDIFSDLRNKLIPEDFLIKNIKKTNYDILKNYESPIGNIDIMKSNIYDDFDIVDVIDIIKNINQESIREAARLYLPENTDDKKYSMMVISPFDEEK